MEPETLPDVDDLYVVTVRKYGLDRGSPWWQRWFFRWLYLPFVRRSHAWFKIPAQGTRHADGSLSWVEMIGIATDREVAEAMCQGEFYCVTRLPVNCGLPYESVHYRGHSYPKAVAPDRYKRRAFNYSPQPTEHLALLAESISELKQTINR